MSAVLFGEIAVGEGQPKVIVPLTGRSVGELAVQATQLAGHALDIVEWRADFLEAADVADYLLAARELRSVLAGQPVLFTFRTRAEGGQRDLANDAYAALNIALIESGLIEAVDIELAIDPEITDPALDAADAAGIPVVGSSHDFAATPKAAEIVERLSAMRQRGMAVAKIAVTPASPDDVLTLLAACRAMKQRYPDMPLIAISMGGLGLVTRLAGQVFGSCATFAMVGRPSAPGQIPVDHLQPVLKLVADSL